MKSYNDIGIDNKLDKDRIAHLFKLGIVASILALSADMILGWGVTDDSLTGLDQYFSRYLTVSDVRIILSAVLGMIGIAVETLCYFGVYRLIASRSEKLAHAYRAGLIGMIAFGPFTHVMCCASIYHLNALNRIDPASASDGAVKFILCFLLPVTVVFFPFFLTAAIVQFISFIRNETPYPKWCCIFSILSGLPVVLLIKLIGNYPAVYAVSTGWISIGSLITFTGLLIIMKKSRV
jgi:hypothetical protein